MLLHVNGFGGTPLIELYLLYHCAAQLLEGQGLKAVRSLVGNYTTSLEMAGASLTVTLLDEETEIAVGCAGAHGGAALVGGGLRQIGKKIGKKTTYSERVLDASA